MQKLKKAVKKCHSIESLVENAWIPKENLAKLNQAADLFSVSITNQMAELMTDSFEDPIRLQFIPNEKELMNHSHQLSDPVGDQKFSPVKGIVHRHKDRCLLKILNTCPVYCRFCFRKDQIGHQEKILNSEELEKAYSYIASHPEIWEVILTGGDPLMLSPQKLNTVFKRLQTIPSVESIRIHTRIPLVDSKRISTEMIQALSCEKALFIVLHANHPKEFTDEGKKAIQNIIHAGIPILSQTVLLKGINDTVETLSSLFKIFIKNRIKPYYLHHCDLVKGTEHFRTSIEAGQHLMRELRKEISGLCLPTYVLDIPGGHGKVPLHPNYITPVEDGYLVQDYADQTHFYPTKS